MFGVGLFFFFFFCQNRLPIQSLNVGILLVVVTLFSKHVFHLYIYPVTDIAFDDIVPTIRYIHVYGNLTVKINL
jgi:hypothetical protein